jgi:hypothetical protein
MVKLVVSKFRTPKHKSRHAISKTRVRNHAGNYVEVFTVDANSASFDDDLTQVFRQNVAAARRENKRLFGSAEGFATATRRSKPVLNGAHKK